MPGLSGRSRLALTLRLLPWHCDHADRAPPHECSSSIAISLRDTRDLDAAAPRGLATALRRCVRSRDEPGSVLWKVERRICEDLVACDDGDLDVVEVA